ncbi:hypothetical protein ACT26D_06030 [Megasphaera elsdenii]|uniref:hypothetical protein n=1 Tax=Megasphaera elsdenii TaxID=907 RepID=UPI004036699F
MTKNTITIYKNDQLQGGYGIYYWEKGDQGGVWEPVTVKLPEGAKYLTDESGRPVVVLKNGHSCRHLFTDWQRDCVVPYLLDTKAARRRILLEVLPEGGNDNAPR